jgi:hypothetical protein
VERPTVDVGDLGWCLASVDPSRPGRLSSLTCGIGADDAGEEVINEKSWYEKAFKDREISEYSWQGELGVRE